MTTLAQTALRTVVAVLVASAVGAAVVHAAFKRTISSEIASLLAARAATGPRSVAESDLAHLPEPVQRWLRWTQVAGKPYPTTVRLRQVGRFRRAEGGRWMPFTAEEHFTTDPPGFVWSTRMRMKPLPFVSIVGRDRYVDGKGSIQMRFLGVVPVADASGPAIDQGSLLRFLNETMWFPAAALSPYITREGIDATSARAAMSYAGVTAAAIFVFDEQGRPIDMRAQRLDLARGRLETWSTPMHAYGEFAGVRIPVAGAGVWKYATGDFPYIELRVTALDGHVQRGTNW
jgi:hypothetical protein